MEIIISTILTGKNSFNTRIPWNRSSAALKKVFWKTKTFFQNDSTILRQIEWGVQRTEFCQSFMFLIILLQFKNLFNKELKCCTKYPNVHIYIFLKRWSFIWGCFFPLNNIKDQMKKELSILRNHATKIISWLNKACSIFDHFLSFFKWRFSFFKLNDIILHDHFLSFFKLYLSF